MNFKRSAMTLHRPRQAIARGLLAGALLAALAGPGCKSPPAGDAAPPDAPTTADLIAAHNARVAGLQQIHGVGVIEFEWQDDKGKHFEQGNAELWIQQPRHTALSVSKVGEVFVWLGSDDQRYWLFDLLRDEKSVHIGRHDQPTIFTQGGVFSVQPLAMLDLMAITPLHEYGSQPEHAASDARLHAWVVDAVGTGGRIRVYFDRQSTLPKRIEVIDSSGDIAVHSILSRYESVTQQGLSPLAFPKLAFQIDIESDQQPADGSAQGLRDGRIKLVLDRATSDVAPSELERVFDLNLLIRGLRPTRIEDPYAAATASLP